MKRKRTKRAKKVDNVSKNFIQNCNFHSDVIWDASTMEVVLTVAQGLVNLTELFKSQKVDLTMIKITADKTILTGKKDEDTL